MATYGYIYNHNYTYYIQTYGMLGGLYPQGLPLLSALSLGDALSADRQIISNYCIPAHLQQN